jgi:hypothetical protein
MISRARLQDLIDDVEDYAASREFKAVETKWRRDLLDSARAACAVPMQPIYAYEWDYSPGVVRLSFESAPYNGRYADRTLMLYRDRASSVASKGDD